MDMGMIILGTVGLLVTCIAIIVLVMERNGQREEADRYYKRQADMRPVIDELLAIIESERYLLCKERGEPFGILPTPGGEHAYELFGLTDLHRSLMTAVREEDWVEAHRVAFALYQANSREVGECKVNVDVFPVDYHPVGDVESGSDSD
jgi:hypothetical protein